MSDESSPGCGCIGYLGTALAVVISYAAWKSIGWVLLHGLFGWIYVVYYLVRYGWPNI